MVLSPVKKKKKRKKELWSRTRAIRFGTRIVKVKPRLLRRLKLYSRVTSRALFQLRRIKKKKNRGETRACKGLIVRRRQNAAAFVDYSLTKEGKTRGLREQSQGEENNRREREGEGEREKEKPKRNTNIQQSERDGGSTLATREANRPKSIINHGEFAVINDDRVCRPLAWRMQTAFARYATNKLASSLSRLRTIHFEPLAFKLARLYFLKSPNNFSWW